MIIVSIRLLLEAPSSMGTTPKVNHSRFDFNLMFLTLGIFTTEGIEKKNSEKNENNNNNNDNNNNNLMSLVVPMTDPSFKVK